MKIHSWKICEDAARQVLVDIRQLLGLSSVQGKQTFNGKSGTTWELDARAWREGSDGFLVIEVRRRTSCGLKQEEIAAIAIASRMLGLPAVS